MMKTMLATVGIAFSAIAMGAGVNVTVNAFEFSGCAFVDGGVLVADDEMVSSVVFVPDNGRGQGAIVRVQRKRKQSQPFTDVPRVFPVQDVEGLASFHRGNDPDPEERYVVYAIGSHESKGDDRRTDREFLTRSPVFKAEDSELDDTDSVRNLLEKMDDSLSENDVDIELTDENVLEGLNIEGLAADGERLTIGFRFPITDEGRAILFRANEADLFDHSMNDVDGEVLKLDLGGRGVRGLCALDTNRLIVLAGPPKNGDETSQVYLYNASDESTTLLHTLDSSLPGAPEGIAVRESGEALVVLDAGGGSPGSIHRIQLDLP